MNKDELKNIYFSFFDQLLPEHAEKAKVNYDEDWAPQYGEPLNHEDAVAFSCDWSKTPEGFTYWDNLHDDLIDGSSYSLQLTPKVLKDKAKDFMSTERMATPENLEELDKLIESIAPPTEPNFGTLSTDPEERKNTPVYSGCINYFPLALASVSRLSKKGNDQHNPGSPLHWDRSKSGDELDAMMRHVIDGDWDAVAWRALAHLQKVEEERLSND
jgi:hypothetical protein